MDKYDQDINLVLVGEVEKHEILYNNLLPGYSRKDITDKAWHDVAFVVNMSAAECKERWRNLRTVFIRKMKPGGSRRSTYYLKDAMQFCVPFIRALVQPSSGNSSEVLQQRSTDEIISNNVEICYDSTSQEDSSEQFPQLITDPLQSSSIRSKRSLVKEETSEDVPEYFLTKKSKFETITVNEAATTSHNTERKEALKMFLLSLIPELEELSDSQIKLFKRRVFGVIDEISTPS